MFKIKTRVLTIISDNYIWFKPQYKILLFWCNYKNNKKESLMFASKADAIKLIFSEGKHDSLLFSRQ